MGDDTVVRSAGKATGNVVVSRLAADRLVVQANRATSKKTKSVTLALLALHEEVRALALLIEKQVAK